jgi:hypothetical protein
MPVAPSSGHASRALLVSAVAIVVLGGALWLATVALGGRNSTDVRLGDQTFQGGSTKRLAKEIADRGPIIYSDVSGERERDMILQHLGDDPDEGWYAFLAAPAEKARDCTWAWDEKQNLFRAKCDESLTAPADGKGLKQFPVTVSSGHIDVDLNASARASTTTAATTPTTSEVIESGEPED